MEINAQQARQWTVTPDTIKQTIERGVYNENSFLTWSGIGDYTEDLLDTLDLALQGKVPPSIRHEILNEVRDYAERVYF